MLRWFPETDRSLECGGSTPLWVSSERQLKGESAESSERDGPSPLCVSSKATQSGVEPPHSKDRRSFLLTLCNVPRRVTPRQPGPRPTAPPDSIPSRTSALHRSPPASGRGPPRERRSEGPPPSASSPST